MKKSILDLPDDVLLDLFSRYVSLKDLGRLDQVCQRFHAILYNYHEPWRTALNRLTNVSFSFLKNQAGCSALQNIRHPVTNIPQLLYLPTDYRYEVLDDHLTALRPLLPNDKRPLANHLNCCSKDSCDINRVVNNYHYRVSLSLNWNRESSHRKNTIIKFQRRSQTSLLQYDEHNHHLWFTHDRTLRCLNLVTNNIEASFESDHDDILCYKVYDDQFICLANGNLLQIKCRKTNEIYPLPINQHMQASWRIKRNDILSLDVYSNDRDRYLILNGSRDCTVSMRTFNMSTRTNQLAWCTKLNDRVLCSRFTADGQYFLIGTSGTSSNYPLVLFNTEKSTPIHLYNANYRHGAGIRCIEWASTNVFIAAGFDNQFKEFDIRTGQCHYTFNDPYGNDYFSLAVSVNDSSGHLSNGVVLGANHHSTVRLVNRRQRQLQNVFFVSKEASPVHSLAVTSEYLFASVDRSIVVLDFTGSNRQLPQINRRF